MSNNKYVMQITNKSLVVKELEIMAIKSVTYVTFCNIRFFLMKNDIL